MNFDFFKYPKTQHLSGSKMGEGDSELGFAPFSSVLGKHVVIEEKIDGANVGISFSQRGDILLQNRGHYFYGGYKERHYDLFKRFANENSSVLYEALGSKYIIFGEWMYAKHTVFYDRLPSYFMEFDIYDKDREVFLDTQSRRKILSALPIVSIPPLAEGIFKTRESILAYLGKSAYISENHTESLRRATEKCGVDYDTIAKETDPTPLMEGLYIKVEEDGIVKQRYKFVRGSYVQSAKEATSRWQSRPIIPNQICPPSKM